MGDFEYVVKLLCGLQRSPSDMRLARGFYATAINIHNPHRADMTITKKLALTYPPEGQQPGKVLPIGKDTLGYDEALEVDCMDVQRELFPKGFPTPYIKGFVVIHSRERLDVTAVYTSASLNEQGEVTTHSSLDVEQIWEHRLPPTELPDLIPVDAAPSGAGAFCVLKEDASGWHLVVTIKNQGPGPAGKSTTKVYWGPVFGGTNYATSWQETLTGILPGQQIEQKIGVPLGWITGEGTVPFKITVDEYMKIEEADETNNTGNGECRIVG